MGLENIAYTMNENGWPFCDRHGTPRAMTRDDIRRVVSNWPEYGGLVFDRKAKDRPAYEDVNLDEVPLREDRAVFPLDLVRAVAAVRQGRMLRPVDKGVKRDAQAYALSGITFCAHCDRLAEEDSNPSLRTRLTGRTDANGIRRYKHKTGVLCGCENRSIPCDVLEEEFGRLLKLLTVNQEAIDLMAELAIQAESGRITDDEEEFERQREEAIAKANRRIDAARNLYADGDLSREDYLARKEQNEREIAHWQTRTTETRQIALELGMCLDAVDKIARLWDGADADDRQGMAQNLFDELVINVDTRRIESFKLKPWADRFLVLRMELYREEYPDLAAEVEAALGEKESPLTDESQGNDMPHRGLRAGALQHLVDAMGYGMVLMYIGQKLSMVPLTDHTPTKCQRNEEIRARHLQGESLSSLADVFGLSAQRVLQIVQGRRK
jgi:hypothetical protein